MIGRTIQRRYMQSRFAALPLAGSATCLTVRSGASSAKKRVLNRFNAQPRSGTPGHCSVSGAEAKAAVNAPCRPPSRSSDFRQRTKRLASSDWNVRWTNPFMTSSSLGLASRMKSAGAPSMRSIRSSHERRMLFRFPQASVAARNPAMAMSSGSLNRCGIPKDRRPGNRGVHSDPLPRRACRAKPPFEPEKGDACATVDGDGRKRMIRPRLGAKFACKCSLSTPRSFGRFQR